MTAFSAPDSSRALSAAERARRTEELMTDDERFSMIISLLGRVSDIGVPRDSFYQIDAVKHERQALGVPLVKIPKGVTDKDPDYQRAITAAQNVRANEQAYVAIRDGWGFEFLDMKANTTANPKGSIAHHDRQILKNMSVQYIDIGSQGSSGSFAASTDQRALLEMQDQAIVDQIAAAVNDVIVKLIVDRNFTVTNYPKWKPGRIAREDVAALADAVTKFKTAGILTPTDEDEEHARSIIHFPDMSEDIKGQNRHPQTPLLPVDNQMTRTRRIRRLAQTTMARRSQMT